MMLNGLMSWRVPGLKRGCPGQPLTPGSFIRLPSKHVPTDEGRSKGHHLSLFTSIQLTHQQLHQCLLFIKALIVSIDSQVVQQKCPLIATHHSLFVSFLSCCNINVKVCNMGVIEAKQLLSYWSTGWENAADPGSFVRLLTLNSCFPSVWSDFH